MSRQKNKFVFFLLMVALLPLCPGLGGSLWAMPPVERMVLPNNLVLLIFEQHSLPFVTFQVLTNAGSWRDPEGKEGLANLTVKSVPLGSTSRPVTQINEDLDFMGAVLNTSCDKDYATLSFKILKKELDHGLGLFMDVLTKPEFPDSEIQKQRANILGTIDASEDQAAIVGSKAFAKALFPGSPYGHNVEGTSESLGRITQEDVKRFYSSFFRPNNTIVAIVGDISVEEVKSKIVPLLSAWPQGDIPKEPFVEKFGEGPQSVNIDRPVTQANIFMGHKGVERQNKDYYAITVMNQILGSGGFGSRLVEEIRIKRGLAYSVASIFVPRKYPGAFEIIVQTKNSSVREAIDLSIQQMEDMQKNPVSERELETAKKYLIGNFPQKFDSQENIAEFLTQMEFFGLPLDYPEKYPSLINSVTREDVFRVAKTYLHPDKVITVVVGELKAAGLGE